MAIRRGFSHLTAVVPTRSKEWLTRKARKERVSRSRKLSDILEAAEHADAETLAPVKSS